MTTTAAAPAEEVRLLLRREADKQPMLLRAMVQRGHAALSSSIERLVEDEVELGGAVLDAFSHVLGARRWCARLCRALANSQPPPAMPTSFEPLPSLAWVRMALEHSQRDMLAFVDELWPMSDLRSKLDHPELGPLNCKEWAVWQEIHDREHGAEIAQLLQEPGALLRTRAHVA